MGQGARPAADPMSASRIVETGALGRSRHKPAVQVAVVLDAPVTRISLQKALRQGKRNSQRFSTSMLAQC
jgi:hypothetical protein